MGMDARNFLFLPGGVVLGGMGLDSLSGRTSSPHTYTTQVIKSQTLTSHAETLNPQPSESSFLTHQSASPFCLVLCPRALACSMHPLA